MRLVILLSACAFVSMTHAAEVVGLKKLTLPDFEGEELIAVPLDSDVYARSGGSYADLRLTDDGTGEEIPYLIRLAQSKLSRKVQQVWHPADFAVKPLADGGLEIRFRSDPQHHPRPPQGIRFRSPVVNFEHHVRVEVSADGIDWRTVVDDGLIFDYSQFMDVRNLAVEPLNLGAENPEYYRLTIADVTQEQQSQLMELSRSLSGDEETGRTERVTVNRQPFRINRIELWIDEVRDDVLGDRREAYPLTIDRTEQDSETRQTYIYLKSHREPLTEISLVTPARNFSRAVRLETPVSDIGIVDSWRQIMDATLSRIDFRTLKRESLTLSFPETRAREYRLVIANGDNPPLDVTAVTAQGRVYELVFLATGGKQYELTYGSGATRAPRYDTVAIATSLAEGFTPRMATIGDEQLVERAQPAMPFFQRLLNSTWAMTAVICVLVLVLAAALYRATRHLEGYKES